MIYATMIPDHSSSICSYVKSYSVFQGALQYLITIMLLADLSVTLLTLLQFYWISVGAFLAVLLILPLSLLSPFPAGLNALFSKEPRRASLTRVYALWNSTSLFNIVSDAFPAMHSLIKCISMGEVHGEMYVQST